MRTLNKRQRMPANRKPTKWKRHTNHTVVANHTMKIPLCHPHATQFAPPGNSTSCNALPGRCHTHRAMSLHLCKCHAPRIAPHRLWQMPPVQPHPGFPTQGVKTRERNHIAAPQHMVEHLTFQRLARRNAKSTTPGLHGRPGRFHKNSGRFRNNWLSIPIDVRATPHDID